MVNEKGRCVILADSHQNALEGIRGLLETMFETVMMVADKKSLFEAIDKVKPDLAVVDLSLKVSGEVNIVREINKHYPELKFLILSLHDEPSAVEDVLSAGAAGYILKRSVAAELFAAIESVQEGRTFVSPSVRDEFG
ncbi:MAG: response regulator [Planctomycetota bacterium]|jgi:DNA-binding NarL/FixJ family response regulator